MAAYLSLTTLSLLTAVVGLLYLCYRRCLCTPLPGIPHNKHAAWTLLGDVPEMLRVVAKEGALFPWLAAQATKYNSPVIQIFVRPFSKPWIIVSDFRETQDILLRRTKEFDRSLATTEVFTGVAPGFHMNLLSHDEEFKYHKLLLRDLMTPGFLHQVAAPHVYEGVSILVKFWSLKAKLAKGHPFDAFDDVFNVLLDSISSVTFGLDIEQGITASRQRYLSTSTDYTIPADINEPAKFTMPPRPPTYEALVTLTSTIAGTVQAPIPWLYFWYISKLPYYRKAYKLKENMINTEVEKGVVRLKQGNITERCALDNVLLREWTAAKKADRQPKPNSRAISDELFGFLVAGEETTGSTMAWAWKFLSNYPQVQRTLRSHLQAAYTRAFTEDQDPTIDEILKTNVPYLDATIEEIHRHALILAVTVRRTQVETTILGHHIPKGYDVAFSLTGPSYITPAFEISDNQRSESCLAAKHHYGSWDPADATEFVPDRWLKRDEDGNEVFDAMAGPQLAFSAGPRGCFGRRLAYLQMRILLVLVLWNLELLGVEGELNSMKGVENVAKVPRFCYLRLKEVEK